MYMYVSILAVLCSCVNARVEMIDGELLGNKIDELVNEDGMGYNILQKIYDDNHDLFETVEIDAEEIVSQFAESMEDKFRAGVRAIRAMKEAVEQEYGKFTTSSQGFGMCCNLNTTLLERNAFMNRKVNFSDACFRVSENALNNPIIPISKGLLKAYQQNYEDNPKIYWQYYGNEDGAFSTYPARSTDSCSNYDPRLRPWYAETSIPTAKDVVIVLDRSESMSITNGNSGKTVMSLAKEAAQTVLGTLNPNDRMGLVYFSNKAHTPTSTGKHSCFKTQMAYAIPDNREAMKDFIGGITTGHDTQYLGALKKAFSLLNHTDNATVDATQRYKAILFITDGKQEDSETDMFEYLESKANFGVKIITYGIGKEVATGPAASRLRQMTEEKYGNGGVYTHIEDASDLRYKMGLYYNAFVSDKATNESDVVITAPYIGYSGLGLVLSMCLPTYYDNKFKGVGCLSINVVELIADAAFFSKRNNSYVFVIDGTGRVISHPLLTQPEDFSRDDWQKDPVFLDIYTLERSNAHQVLDKMRRGESGSEDLVTTIVRPSADSRRDGVSTKDMETTYTWKKIPHANMSICVVVERNRTKLEYRNDEPRTLSKHFIYHRLDLDPTLDRCAHMERLSTLDGPSVKFTPSAFKDPIRYIYNEDIEDAKGYRFFFEGDESVSTEFKDGLSLRTIVALTQQMKSHWKSDYLYKEQTIWTYVGLQAGAYIQYPGLQYDRRYDHTKSPWYRRAMNNIGFNVISAPFTDAGLTGTVLSIARTLYQGSSQAAHSETDPVVGVLGMDIKLDTLRHILYDTFPDCSKDDYSCFLVDTSGYLVYHVDFYKSGERVENVHIISKEASISDDLIQNSHLVRNQCDDFESKASYHTWELSINGGVIDKLGKLPSYKAEVVQNTNIYIFIRSTGRTLPNKRCSCQESGIAMPCKSIDKESCECPCTTPITNFYYCNNTFPFSSDSPDLCYPSSPVLQFQSPSPDEKKLLESAVLCYISNCSSKSELECRSSVLCDVCEDGSCVRARTCPISTVPPEPTTKTDEEGPSDIPMIAGTAVGVIALLLVIIVIVTCVVVKRRGGKRGNLHNPVLFAPNSASSIGEGSLYGISNPAPSESPYSPLPDLHSDLTPLPHRNHQDVYLNPDRIVRT